MFADIDTKKEFIDLCFNVYWRRNLSICVLMFTDIDTEE